MAVENDKIVYGGNLMLFLGETTKLPVAFSTDAKLDIQLQTREISSKDSGKWEESAGNKLSWTSSTDALYAEDLTSVGVNAVEELYALMIERKPVDFAFGVTTGTAPEWTMDATKKNFTGKVIITGLSLNAPDGDSATYSLSLKGTGALTMV